MDSNIDSERNPGTTDQSIVPDDIQVNPLTIMTSPPSFTSVDDNQQTTLELVDINPSQSQSQTSEAALSSFNADISSPNIFVSTLNVADQQASSNVHMDNRSVAAWVESTTTGAILSVLERSPSLPSTLLEPIVIRNRRDSNVSTVCDQQQSIISDTLTSQQISYSTEMQRSISVPLNDQYLDNDNDDHNDEKKEFTRPENDEEGEDGAPIFLAIPESEDSEVDKKPKKQPLTEEKEQFQSRSPTTRENQKKSSNVSFHTSVSFETTHQKPLTTHRRRRNSWNTNKNKPSSFQRSYSHITTNQPPSLHAQILRKQFRTALSMPTGASSYSIDSAQQLSPFAESVYLSSPNTDSSSLHSASHLAQRNRFLAIPSSTSIISSDHNPSIISDASGRSGIESTNLETSISDQVRVLSINDDELSHQKPAIFRQIQQRNSPLSTTTSETPSTQSLSSSSDDEMNDFDKKMNDLNMGKGKRKASTDKRRDVLKQLMWLLEKKTTIYARSNMVHQKPVSPVKQQHHHHHQKPAPNSFVEVFFFLHYI